MGQKFNRELSKRPHPWGKWQILEAAGLPPSESGTGKNDPPCRSDRQWQKTDPAYRTTENTQISLLFSLGLSNKTLKILVVSVFK